MRERLLDSGVCVIEPKGYLFGTDGESVELRRRIKSLLDDSQRYVVIDCWGVKYVDQGGLDLFRDIEVALVIHGGKVVFSRVDQRTAEAMKIIRLDQVLELYDSTEQAVFYLARLIREASESNQS